MATVPEEYSTDEQRSVVHFLWAKWLNTMDIHKQMLPVYGGNCLSRKAVHNWAEEFSLERSEVPDDARAGAEVTETSVKWLLCCGFRRIGKAMGQVYQCWWRICRQINVSFQVRISHVLRFISICDLFTDSPPYIQTMCLEHVRITETNRSLESSVWPFPIYLLLPVCVLPLQVRLCRVPRRCASREPQTSAQATSGRKLPLN
jgi:hypothetical protein